MIPNLSKSPLILFFVFIAALDSYSQGIRGVVRGSNDEPLPYASIFLAGSKSGTSTNANGEYEIKLAEGTHILRIQFIGYTTQEVEVKVDKEWLSRDFKLQVQGYLLQEVQVDKGKKQDYAYTIIRNAIAKSKFHRLQYSSYQMKVYVKGTGELEKAPFFVRGKLKKEGVKLNEAYTSELVSIINFSQPDKVKEKVIAIRSTGENSGVGSPSMFINETFYKDKVANVVSPLSPAAFRFYTFRYEGSFTEGKNIINRIRVIPRSRGDNVFEGHIFIIEDEWAIHSVNLRTSILGFPIWVKQTFAEVAPHVWLAVNHHYEFSGNVLGFAGRYKYFASCSQVKVVLNKDLIEKVEVLDAPPANQATAALPPLPSAKAAPTRKEFRKMVDNFEKESLKAQKNPEIVKERDISTDTLARKRDSLFWDDVRSVPLTVKEVQGYRRDDSLAKIEKVKISGKDTSGVIKHKKFNPLDVITGAGYNLSPRTSLRIDPSFTQFYFNTVEGFNPNLSGELKYRFDSLKRSVSFLPTLRYGLASETFYSKLGFNYKKTESGLTSVLSLEGGRFVSQYNAEDPIHPLVNSVSSLIGRRNYMKIYEKTNFKAGYLYKPSAFLSVSLNGEFARRKELFNQTDYSFFEPERKYSDNRPFNIENISTAFPTHNALIADVLVKYRPIQRYRSYNGRKVPIFEGSPELLLSYKKGISGIFDSEVDYDQVEIGMNHELPAGLGSLLNFELRGGTFLNSRKTYFMDYKHFDANRTFLGSLKPAGSFRVLDYYKYSTDGPYVTANAYYKLRKLLFTRIPAVRLSGLKESLFVNYLKTEKSPHYYELGYSLDNVFRIFRVELATSFEDRNYKDFGVRVGIATMFQVNR